jgi:hypothetical protein
MSVFFCFTAYRGGGPLGSARLPYGMLQPGFAFQSATLLHAAYWISESSVPEVAKKLFWNFLSQKTALHDTSLFGHRLQYPYRPAHAILINRVLLLS